METTRYRLLLVVMLLVSLAYFSFGGSNLLGGLQRLDYAIPSTHLAQVDDVPQSPPLSVQYLDEYTIRPLAPTQDLDVIWQTHTTLQIIQGVTTAIAAVATLFFIVRGFAQTKSAHFALIGLCLSYLLDEIFAFFRIGVYGLSTTMGFGDYNFYFFNLLEFLLIASLVIGGWFLVQHVSSGTQKLPSGRHTRVELVSILLVAVSCSAFFFAGQAFITYKDAASQYASGQNPTYLTNRMLLISQADALIGNFAFDADAEQVRLETLLYKPSSYALRSELSLDQLWSVNLISKIIGTVVTFSLALATIALAIWSFNGSLRVLSGVILSLFLTFMSYQFTLFIASGLYAIGQFESYQFSYLGLAMIASLCCGLLVAVVKKA